MKVLFITRKWPPAIGGMETYSRELAGELQQMADVDVMCLEGRADGRPPTFIMLTGFAIRTCWRLTRSRKTYQVCHGGDLAIWPLLWIAHFRNRDAMLVLSAHGTDISYAFRSGALAFLYRVYLQLALRLLPDATVIANSSATRQLCEKSGFSRIEVVRLGARISATGKSIRLPFVLYLGRLVPMKGCAWFIREVLPLLDADLRLVVGGAIWDAGEKDALDNPRVEFLGPVAPEDRSRLCQAATAVVVPNRGVGIAGFEGFGLSATEAAAAGGVVLASAVHGLAEAVEDGVTGFLLPAGNARAWAGKIAEIRGWSESELEDFLRKSVQHVSASYSWKGVAEHTLAIYEKGKDRRERG